MLETVVRVNLSPATGRLSLFIRRIQGDLVRRIGTRIAVQTRRRIKTEKTDPDGGRWPPRTSGGSWPLLVKTGSMLSSVGYKRIDRSSGGVSVGVEYARFVNAHRRFIGLSTSNIDDIDTLIDRWIGTKLR